MKNHWTIGIMAALGMMLGKLLLPVLGEYIEKQSINKVTKEEVNSYMKNSADINFVFKDYKYYKTYYEPNFLVKSDLFAPYKICSNYEFYDGDLKKYFAIKMFNYTNVNSFNDILDFAKNKKIEFLANAQELKSKSYGTKDKPIPIFSYYVPYNKSWTESEKMNLYDIKNLNEHYPESVFYHLTYLTPRDEFKKMFPEAK